MELGILSLRGDRLGSVQEISEYLVAIDHAYNSILVFDAILKKNTEGISAYGLSGYSYVSKKGIKVNKRISESVLPEDKLKLLKVNFNSPGLWAFLGSILPLNTIREYIKDKHERQKDFNYRIQAEREKMYLENELLKNRVFEERIRILKQYGYSDEDTAKAVNHYFVKPLGGIDQYLTNGLITDVNTEKYNSLEKL